MKKLFWCLSLISLAAWGLPCISSAQVQVGVSVNSGGDSFNLAIGNYFHAPPEQVAVVEQRHIPDEESPVVFFIASHAHVAPGVILDLRAGGMGWGAIAERYRLGPKVFYVPARGNFAGTPYEGFYHGYRRHGYRMSDADIVNMVNLGFATNYYHKPAAEIIRMRASGQDFRSIHEHYHPYHPAARTIETKNRKERRGDKGHHDDHGGNDHGDNHNDKY